MFAVLSILLWIFVSLSNEYFTTFSVPIKYINVPEGYLVTNSSADDIALSIKGNGWSLAQISFGREASFLIDVKGELGKQTALIRNQMNNNSWISSNLQLIEITPNIVSFNVEKLFEKKVSVEPKFKFSVADGYGLVSKLTMEPDSVEISGSKNSLNKISVIRTIEKDFGKLNASLQTFIDLQKIKDIHATPSKVKINIDIEKIVDKTIENIEVKTINVPKRQTLEIIPTKIKIVLRGGLNKLALITEKDLQAFADFNDAIRDTLGTIEPKIIPPEYMEVLDVTPKKLKYIIKKY